MKYGLIIFSCILAIALYKIDKYQTEKDSKLVKVKVIKKEQIGSGNNITYRIAILYNESVYKLTVKENIYNFLNNPKIKDMYIYGNLISIYKRGKLSEKYISEIFISEDKIYDYY